MVTEPVPTENLTNMGRLLAKMLASIHGALLERDEDAYSTIGLNGREMGIASDIVLLFALAGPSYTKENLALLGCPFCHRPAAEVPNESTTTVVQVLGAPASLNPENRDGTL